VCSSDLRILQAGFFLEKIKAKIVLKYVGI